MKVVFGVIALIILLIAVLLLFSIRLYIEYEKNEKTGETWVICRYLFFKFRLIPNEKKGNKPKKKDNREREEREISYEKKRRQLEHYIRMFELIKDDAAKILKYAASKAVVFEKIGIKIDFGFENAMHTGIFTGLLNGFVYNILALIHNFSRLDKMDVNIQPKFEDTPVFKTRFECIVKLKTVHIIIITFSILKIMMKIKKTEGSI